MDNAISKEAYNISFALSIVTPGYKHYFLFGKVIFWCTTPLLTSCCCRKCINRSIFANITMAWWWLWVQAGRIAGLCPLVSNFCLGNIPFPNCATGKGLGLVQTNEKNHSSHIIIIPPEQVMGPMIWGLSVAGYYDSSKPMKKS